MFNSLLAFFFWKKHLPSQVLKDFSVENLETTPSTFLSKFSSEIYLSRIISYWGSIFTLYLTWGAFSLVCALFTFQSDIVRIWAQYHTITLILQSERLKQLTLILLITTVYLSHLPNPTPGYYLFCVHSPKCKEMRDVSFFYRDWEKNNNKHFQC